MTFTEELEIILEKELAVLLKLKDISFEKTDTIINNDIKELEDITKQEEVLVNEIGLLENRRGRLFDTWGLDVNTPVSSVIEKTPEDNSRLIVIANNMRQTMEDLALRNRLNNDLIVENLDWIDFNINLMTNAHTSPGYGSDDKNRSGNSIFDRKV